MRASVAVAAFAFGAAQATKFPVAEECKDMCVWAVKTKPDWFCPKVLAEEKDSTYGLIKCKDAAAVSSACECIYTPPATTSSEWVASTSSEAPTYPTTSEEASSSSAHWTKKPKYTTSTVYTTNVYTVTSCPPEKVDCPWKHKPTVVTETIPYTTTVCEVEETWTPEPEYPCKTCGEWPEAPEETTSTYCPPTTMGTTYIPAQPTKSVTPVIAGAGRIEGGVVAAVVGLVAALL